MSKLPTNRISTSSPSKLVFRSSHTPIDPRQINPTRGDSTNRPLRIHDRVSNNGKSATVAYIGPTQFAEGEWIGIILDEIQGKNDGSYNGVRYFHTDANRGLFCRTDKLQHLSANGSHQRTSIISSARATNLGENNYTSRNSTADGLNPSNLKDLEIGDRVVIRGTKYGTLKYIGRIHIDEGIWCGIKLDGPWGKHDGKVHGTRYFTVSHRYGVFAPLRHVEKVPVGSNDRSSRASIISTDSNSQFHDSASQDSHLSEFSVSSRGSDSFTPRSPSKPQQRNPSTDVNTMQSALSAEIFTLREAIVDKERSIKNFEQQNEEDRAELSNATRKVTELQSRLATLQEQNQIHENENKRLIKEQLELTQRLDDLQYQLDEYKFVEANQEHLVKQDEMTAHEQVVQLESMNAKLAHEKQMFQEQLREKEIQTSRFIDEMKKQIELLRGQVSDLEVKDLSHLSQLIEQETLHKQQLNEYQAKLDQISQEEQTVRFRLKSLEQETEKRVNDLSNELKRQRESIVPDLQRQCQTLKSELENRAHTANMALSERETYYQQQIEAYQANINQAARETERAQAELKHRNEENARKEKQADALIQELQESYQQIQTKLSNQEQQVNATLNQRESFYAQQLKEYEESLNRATRETENIQAELAKLEEEKASHDQTSNTTIRSLREDHEQQYETLQNQLNELQDQDRTQNVILNERIGRYEIEIKEYQIKHDQDLRELATLRNELIRIQEEKTSNEKQFHETINTLRDDLERLQRELNEREHQTNLTLVERDLQYKQQLNENGNVTRQLQTELAHLQKEKSVNEEQLTDTINKLKHDLEVLQMEFENRDHTEKEASNESAARYQSEIESYQSKNEESLRELENLQSELLKLQEEKTNNDNQFHEDIHTLKQQHERQLKELQIELDELNERALKANKTLHQRENQFEEQLSEYREKLEQATLRSDHLQGELTKYEHEQTEYNETINKLEQDLQTFKTELETRDHTQTMAYSELGTQIQLQQAKHDETIQTLEDLRSELAKSEENKTTLNETIDTLKQDLEKLREEVNEQERANAKSLHEQKSQYEQEIDEYQKNLELSLRHTHDVQTELATFQEEKDFNDKGWNDRMNSLEQDLQAQIERITSQYRELQERHDTQSEEILRQEQRLKDVDQLDVQIDELQEQNLGQIKQINQLQLELDEARDRKEQDEIFQCAENLSVSNQALKKEVEDLKNENKQLRNVDNDQSTEKQSEIDRLNRQLDDLQQMNLDLVEKQAHIEEQYTTSQKTQEKLLKEKIAELEMKMALMKSEYMVEMENTKLDHDQAMLRLKTQYQQTTSGKGKK